MQGPPISISLAPLASLCTLRERVATSRFTTVTLVRWGRDVLVKARLTSLPLVIVLVLIKALSTTTSAFATLTFLIVPELTLDSIAHGLEPSLNSTRVTSITAMR